MTDIALLWTARVFAACIAFSMGRLLIGPRGPDRLSALSVISALVLAILVLKGVYSGSAAYLDVALVYDIFGFLGIMAIAAFIKEKH